jgi:hypothetical protein
MEMTAVAEYVQDYECVIEGVEFCFKLQEEMQERRSMEVLKKHYDAHPEDKLCEIYRPSDQRMVLCRRAGVDAIHRMAARLVAEAPDGYDLSRKRIAEIISRKILQVAIDGVTDDTELVRILKTYVDDSRAEHMEVSYWFACILLHDGPPDPELGPPTPDRLNLGPVTFLKYPIFAADLKVAIDKGEKHAEEKALDLFAEIGKDHGWVASVSIPSCAPDVSRARAEEVVEAAINLMKVLIGLG